MEHKTITELERAGEATLAVPLTRTDRLERWAAALERLGNTQLTSLPRTEHVGQKVRSALSADQSPLSVAFDDPVLRLSGLKDDSYGEAKRYFEVTDYELHWVVCSCHFGEWMSAREVARRVRAMAAPRASIARWFGQTFFGRAAY